MARFDTAGNIVSRAAQELGLGKLDDPFASQDPAISQMCGLIASCGQELAKLDWEHLIREWTFQIEDGKSVYRLPADYQKQIKNTAHDRTANQALLGPVLPAGWQALRASLGSVAINAMFRLTPPSSLRFPAGHAPAVGATVAVEYQSRNWVTPADKIPADYDLLPIALGADAPVKSADLVLFDSLLMIKAVKLAFRKARRFDTTVEQTEYDDALQIEQGMAPSPTLYLDGSGLTNFRAIDFNNIVGPVGG